MLNSGWTVLLVAIGYFVWTTWGRWRFIALPHRARLLADLAEITALTLRPGDHRKVAREGPINAINELFEIEQPQCGEQTNLLKSKLRRAGPIEIVSWSGKLEEEASNKLAIAQFHVPDLLSDEEVTARLIVARGWLTEYGDKAEHVALGRQIDAALGKQADPLLFRPQRDSRWARLLIALRPASGVSVTEAHNPDRALLGEALVQTYVGPGVARELIWHRKTSFVLVSGLTAIVLLAFFNGADRVLLLGAVGGLLQRLWQLVYERDAKSSSPLFWSTLFLAPVAGALAAVGGLYLISLLNVTKVFGPSVSHFVGFTGINMSNVTVGDAGFAFLLGFSAQLLGNLATRSESVVGSSFSSTPHTVPPTGTP